MCERDEQGRGRASSKKLRGGRTAGVLLSWVSSKIEYADVKIRRSEGANQTPQKIEVPNLKFLRGLMQDRSE